MARFRWSEDKVNILIAKYPKAESLDELAAEIGCSVDAIYRKAFQLKLFRGQRRGSDKFLPREYTLEQFHLVRSNYQNMSTKTLSVISGVHPVAIKKWAYIHGWHKSERYRTECMEYAQEKHREHVRRWRAAHRDQVREYNRRYRNKRKGNDRTFDTSDADMAQIHSVHHNVL